MSAVLFGFFIANVTCLAGLTLLVSVAEHRRRRKHPLVVVEESANDELRGGRITGGGTVETTG